MNTTTIATLSAATIDTAHRGNRQPLGGEMIHGVTFSGIGRGVALETGPDFGDLLERDIVETGADEPDACAATGLDDRRAGEHDKPRRVGGVAVQVRIFAGRIERESATGDARGLG
jgi:hypothetical protein